MKTIFLNPLVRQFLAGIIVIGSLSFFQFRGITYFDEGYILAAASRLLHGEIPYRDFDMVYTPVSYLYTSAFFAMFSESVLIGRIAALSIAILSIGAIYLLLRLFTKNVFVIFLSVLFFISWGPTHINFPWPTMFALCSLLYASYFFLRAVLKNEKNIFFLAGIMTVIIFLSKQNFGAGALLIFFFAFPLLKMTDKKRNFVYYTAGVFSLSFGYAFYLVLTDSFIPFIQNMYLYTLKRVLIDKTIETPFLYEGSLLAKFIKTLFYTSPLLISIAAFVTLPKTKRFFVLLPAMTGMFYLLGIRPTTDYVHVVSLLSLVCVPFSLIIVFAERKIVRYSAIVLLMSMTLLGFYTAYFKGYYQWQLPMKEMTTFASYDRAKIYLPVQERDEINKLVTYIQTRTKSTDFIFVNAYCPMVYFLSARKNPTRYDFISTNQLPLSYQKKIIDRLEAEQVRLVVVPEMNISEKELVENYINKNYKITKKIGPFFIFER